MGMFIKVVLLTLTGLGAFLLFNAFGPQTIPQFDPEEFWGPKEMMDKQDKTVRPFKIKFDEEMIKDLKSRLKNHRRFTPPLEGVAFEYGFNTNQIDNWLNYWADKYNFSEREAFLNKFPHYKTNIQGLDIHFIRVKPQVSKKDIQVVPLLMMHGWPGSIREFYEAIPPLTRETPGYNFVFELVVPSIPGYGFSDPAVRPGLGIPQVAVIFKNLMNRLGHKKFYVQGGDAGAAIASAMSTIFPKDILGHHSNLLITQVSKKDIQVVPLLMMHGWPGSIREFYEAIPPLTRETPGYNFMFELVVPSIPGYGFSDPAVRPGLGIPQVAVIFKNLMNRLGHKKFYVQGGDAGAAIASAMSTIFPKDILGHHSNLLITQHTQSMIGTLIGAVFPSLIVEDHLADRMYPLSSFFAYVMEEFGYMHIQATKPDTIGVPLTDSPAGLLAYILEKFSTWTRKEHKSKPDGGLEFRFTKDQLIDNLMIYWSTNSITTSMRFYAENLGNKMREQFLDKITTPVPTWALQAKHELFYQPPRILNRKFVNLVNTTVLDDGGHFLAFELPQVFAEDVFKAVKAFREWHQKNKKTEL